MRRAAFDQGRRRQGLGIGLTTWAAVRSLNSGASASLAGRRPWPAMTCIKGPTLPAGEDGVLIDALQVLEVVRDESARRAARAGSCGWSSSRDPRGVPGSRADPPATSPAMWAMSATMQPRIHLVAPRLPKGREVDGPGIGRRPGDWITFGRCTSRGHSFAHLVHVDAARSRARRRRRGTIL